MKFAIIAAGEGSRLAGESVSVPKPLVRVHGETLIDRLIRIFTENGADEIVVIMRQDLPLNTDGRVPVRKLVCATPSSMHSFYEISNYLRDAPFVLTTVDTVFREDEFCSYVEAFRRSVSEGKDGLMGVTDFVDDENPLFIKGDDAITAFLDNDADHECRYISGGIYGLTPRALDTLSECINSGQSRMRNFQRALLTDGLDIHLYPFTKILDIDHASDIVKAERFLRGRIVGIYRARLFSPNCTANDHRIMDLLLDRLNAHGYDVSGVEEEELISTNVLPSADIYLSMARTPSVMEMLYGHRVVNGIAGTLLCSNRMELKQFMDEIGIPTPPILTSPTEDEITRGIWIKKSIGTTVSPHDTEFCSSKAEYLKCIDNFNRRGIHDFIIEPHERGDLIKFYGVASTDFFRIIYPTESDRTKFGLEAINGLPHYYQFHREMFQQNVTLLAESLGVKVYGGDAVIHADGTFSIIDFNDWPSFSSVADEAAEAISSIISI